MLLFLYGKDTYRSRQQLHKMMSKFRQDRDPQGLNVVQLDAAKEKTAMLWEQILAAPFLAERRMVVLENISLHKHTEFHDMFLNRVVEGTLPDSTIVVCWEAVDSVKKKEPKALFTRLAAEKYAQRFDILSESQLEGWIAAEVQERGGHIIPKALRYLRDNVGVDMWRLSSVIDQLLAYADGKGITEEDVRLFVSERIDDSIFALVDAIVARYPKKVFRMLQEQYRQGKEVPYVYAMVLRQFRILLHMRDMLDRGVAARNEVMAKQLGVHPFVIKKSLPLVERYTLEELQSVYAALLQLDVQIKTGQGDQRVLMDVFVGQMCMATA